MRVLIRRLLVTLAAAASVAATVIAPAAADGPVIIEDTLEQHNLWRVGSAPLACTGGYNVKVDAVIERRRIQTYDENGNLLLERRHTDFSGTLSNTLTGYTVPWSGHFNTVRDLVAGTVTVTGLRHLLVAPGEGRLDFDAGRTVTDLDTNEIVFSAGSHEFVTELCSALNQ